MYTWSLSLHTQTHTHTNTTDNRTANATTITMQSFPLSKQSYQNGQRVTVTTFNKEHCLQHRSKDVRLSEEGRHETGTPPPGPPDDHTERETHRARRERTLQHRHTHTHLRQNQDNIDCRRIDHLAPHKVHALQVAKKMKTHNSQFWLCNVQHWLQSKMTAVCPSVFEILTTSTFGALSRKSHCVNSI